MGGDLAELELRQAKEGVILSVHARPGASRSQVAGVHGGALRVRIQARAVEGRANEALTTFLAQQFETRPRRVSIVAGHLNARKRVLLADFTLADARERLRTMLAASGRS